MFKKKKDNMIEISMTHFTVLLMLTLFIGLVSSYMFVANAASTRVPGHEKDSYDQDQNGYPDEGVQVNGKYTSLYAYDDLGDWYWDLGDGRVQGTVDSETELDQETLTTCDYQVNYRGTFENDSFMDSGFIQNHINCSGYDDNGTYNYDIVHESNPKYRGIPAYAIWGNWEYHTKTESKSGNLVRPDEAIGL